MFSSFVYIEGEIWSDETDWKIEISVTILLRFFSFVMNSSLFLTLMHCIRYCRAWCLLDPNCLSPNNSMHCTLALPRCSASDVSHRLFCVAVLQPDTLTGRRSFRPSRRYHSRLVYAFQPVDERGCSTRRRSHSSGNGDSNATLSLVHLQRSLLFHRTPHLCSSSRAK